MYPRDFFHCQSDKSYVLWMLTYMPTTYLIQNIRQKHQCITYCSSFFNFFLSLSFEQGIYDGPYYHANSTRTNHSKVVVGYYISEEDKDYWIVKNLRGTTWEIPGLIACNQRTCSILEPSISSVLCEITTISNNYTYSFLWTSFRHSRREKDKNIMSVEKEKMLDPLLVSFSLLIYLE